MGGKNGKHHAFFQPQVVTFRLDRTIGSDMIFGKMIDAFSRMLSLLGLNFMMKLG
jgi:hypothetical protein